MAMPFMTFSVQHGQTIDEARRHVETAIHELTSRCGPLVRRVEWSTDRSQVRLEGHGFWIELRVDAYAVHVSADFPVLGRLLGRSVATRLQEILHRTFARQLPGGHGRA
jgi:hypothetical protein